MAIKNWLITGDTHGQTAYRLSLIQENMPEYNPAETAVIILGDVGFNYYLKKSDWKNKHRASKYGYTLYCLRGNHESRVENLSGMTRIYDENVDGFVWMEEEFPLIKYFDDDYGEYTINGHSCLTIGGAYSVDKWYRLQCDLQWFADEQLTQQEMNACAQLVKGKHYDFVLTHTCPISWEPSDLFLHCVNQSTVDKTMEVWMDQLKDTFFWGVWCFGHFHADRLERPAVEQFFQEFEELEKVWNRWYEEETFKKEWWIPKAPMFYVDYPEEVKENET